MKLANKPDANRHTCHRQARCPGTLVKRQARYLTHLPIGKPGVIRTPQRGQVLAHLLTDQMLELSSHKFSLKMSYISRIT